MLTFLEMDNKAISTQLIWRLAGLGWAWRLAKYSFRVLKTPTGSNSWLKRMKSKGDRKTSQSSLYITKFNFTEITSQSCWLLGKIGLRDDNFFFIFMVLCLQNRSLDENLWKLICKLHFSQLLEFFHNSIGYKLKNAGRILHIGIPQLGSPVCFCQAKPSPSSSSAGWL